MIAIKNFFSNLIKPIIGMPTMMVGTDTAKSPTATMPGKHLFWSETHSSPMGASLSHKPIRCDRSSDGFPFIYANIYGSFTETFFDCDDYIDEEDTVDFVAETTKKPYNSFAEDIVGSSFQSMESFYDCTNKFSGDSPAKMPVKTTVWSPLPPTASDGKVTETKIDEVQYNDDKCPPNHSKFEHPVAFANINACTNRRKRKGRRKYVNSNRQNRSHKNWHEKTRQAVKMNIHEDIDDCSIAQEVTLDDDEDDLEIINVDEPKTTTAEPITPKTTIDTPFPSPELMSGCIFTRFFRFDNCKQKQMPLPLRCLTKYVAPARPVKEPPVHSRYPSETESDDSFIVFEENSPRCTASADDPTLRSTTLKPTYQRERQISECSDDFILFEHDTADNGCLYDTTDEDFTDSTDDSDSEDG